MFPEVLDLVVDEFTLLVQLSPLLELSDELPCDTTLELLMLANAYGVARLEQLCARKLAARLDAQNVAEIGRCAGMIGEAHLERAAGRYAAYVSQKCSPEC